MSLDELSFRNAVHFYRDELLAIAAGRRDDVPKKEVSRLHRKGLIRYTYINGVWHWVLSRDAENLLGGRDND